MPAFFYICSERIQPIMKKSIYLSLIIYFISLHSVFADFVNKAIAARVAYNFYMEKLSSFPFLQNRVPLLSQPIEVNYSGRPVYYVFNVDGGGFVIVSASENTVPVIGYSFEGTYGKGDLPCNFRSWMDQYSKQITDASQSKRIIPEYIKSEWKRLKDPDFKLIYLDNNLSVQPLLTSNWNQDVYYNEQCPADPAGPGGHTYAGCVATAMGQLMYFYRFPQQGSGSYTYQHPIYGSISANFDTTTYQWDGMPNEINSSNYPIANLLFHLGVSVDMDYGPDGSGMWNHKAAYSLRTYFKYGPETQYIFRDSTSIDWDSILIANLNAGKPLYYAGWEGVASTNGHAFVCDGYQDTTYFHFNWGWSGSYNGYFYLNQLNPGGSNFNFAQEVIKDIFPDTLNYTYPPNCQGPQLLHYISGSIDDGSGFYSYENNQECSWLIAPEDIEQDSITSITLAFCKFDTEAGFDSVTIYQGETITSPVLGSFSGNTLPPVITASGDKMLITFHSNASVSKPGWMATWNCQFPIYCSGTTTLTEPFGSLGDGSGNKHYNNNSICKWKIQPPGASSVTLSFSSFDTEAGYDNLKIYDLVTQQLLATNSGNQIPPAVTAESGKMLLIFTTNSSIIGQGWEATYSVGNVGKDEDEISVFSSLYPNPCYGIAKFAVNLPLPQQMLAEILDTKGVIRHIESYQGNAGLNTYSLDLSHNEPGIYLIHITSGNISQFKQIILLSNSE
jgi:hypothetical protein